MEGASDMTPGVAASFALVGGGWRAESFVRVARSLPDRFHAIGALVRNGEKGAVFEERWNVPTHRTLDGLLKASPDFVVLSVPWPVTPALIHELAGRSVPVLAETPPAPDLEGLLGLRDLLGSARVQIAEQYPFQPLHAARISLARSGKLGRVTQAQVSAAHDYHGMALIRKLLGVGLEEASITARRLASPAIAGPDRTGPPESERSVSSEQTVAVIEFGESVGVYDFDPEQYFSWIRSNRVLVRGERGEVSGSEISYLKDYRTPVALELTRRDAGHDGNLEGYYHQGILAGAEWVYRNPFSPARLSDDEIAVATVLQKMAEYAAGGADFYGLAEASQDHYLGLVTRESAASGETVRATTQPWAS